jgi:hypothetical protein
LDNIEDSYSGRDDEVYSVKENGSIASKGKEMSVEYLENDVDIFQGVDDWDGMSLFFLINFFLICFFFCSYSLLFD